MTTPLTTAARRLQNVLVTGGAGFIGANFVHWLLARDNAVRVVNLDALTYAGSPDNLRDLPDPARHRFVQGDICDRALVDRLLREHRIDTLVHFAAESHVDRSIAGPGEFVRTNLVGTWTLLEAARQYRQEQKPAAFLFHHISTDEVYGTLDEQGAPFSESMAYAPNSPYSASKAGSDHLVRAYFHTYGLPVTTSNCSNNFGRFQHAEKLIPTVLRACTNGTPIPVYGNGRNVRDWLYVDDHCAAIHAVLQRGEPGGCWNVGGNNELRNIDLVTQLCALMDERRPAAAPHARLIEYVSDRPGHDWRYAIDAGHIRETLGWRPATPFAAALATTVDWYLAHPQRLQP